MLLKNSRTLNRIAAIQCIYCHYFTKFKAHKLISDITRIYSKENHENLQEELGQEFFLFKLAPAYLEGLVLSCLEHENEINQMISDNLKNNWSLSKIHLILLSIIKVGIAEMMFLKSAPFQVVISEFTDIAGHMLERREVAFVNSIMQKIHNDTLSS